MTSIERSYHSNSKEFNSRVKYTVIISWNFDGFLEIVIRARNRLYKRWIEDKLIDVQRRNVEKYSEFSLCCL